MSEFRVAKLSRNQFTVREEFMDDGFRTVEQCVELANRLNMKDYTSPEHYYGVVDREYWLKNQPDAGIMSPAEMERLIAHLEAQV